MGVLLDWEEKRYDDSLSLHARLNDWLDAQNVQPKHLAHYTSIESAAAIILSGQVFLFNALTLNDEQEIDHALEFIANEFKGEPLKALGESVGDFLSYRRERHPSVYMFCLSQVEQLSDLDDLSMWRAYGDDGNGVALAFKPAALAMATSALTMEKPRLAKVIYKDDEKRDLLIKLAEQFQIGCKAAGYSPEDMSDALEATLWRLAPVLKHSAFEDEHEWRLVVQVRRMGKSHGDASHIQFAGNGKPYVSVELNRVPGKGIMGQLDAGPFKKALIGPSKSARQNAGIIGAALTKTQAQANVEYSSIPYRGRA